MNINVWLGNLRPSISAMLLASVAVAANAAPVRTSLSVMRELHDVAAASSSLAHGLSPSLVSTDAQTAVEIEQIRARIVDLAELLDRAQRSHVERGSTTSLFNAYFAAELLFQDVDQLQEVLISAIGTGNEAQGKAARAEADRIGSALGDVTLWLVERVGDEITALEDELAECMDKGKR